MKMQVYTINRPEQELQLLELSDGTAGSWLGLTWHLAVVRLLMNDC